MSDVEIIDIIGVLVALCFFIFIIIVFERGR